jgi:hypothetical protein
MSATKTRRVRPAEKHRVLLLRTNTADMKSYGGFTWPEKGWCEAPDWDPTPECGHGLHGLLWGEGKALLLGWVDNAKWLVVEADARELVDLEGKVKVPKAYVLHVGDQVSATQYLYGNGGRGYCIHGLTLTGGYESMLIGGDGSVLTGGNRSTLTGGDESTLTGGDESTLTGGYESTLTGGYGSTLTGGDESTLTGGDESKLVGGDWSTLTGGDESTLAGGNRSTLAGGNRSTLTGGDESTLTGGDESTLTGGDESTLAGGNRSTLAGGYGSTLTGGDYSTLIFRWHDGNRVRFVVAYVGEDGIEAGKPYRCADGKVSELPSCLPGGLVSGDGVYPAV